MNYGAMSTQLALSLESALDALVELMRLARIEDNPIEKAAATAYADLLAAYEHNN